MCSHQPEAAPSSAPRPAEMKARFRRHRHHHKRVGRPAIRADALRRLKGRFPGITKAIAQELASRGVTAIARSRFRPHA